jgi:anti-sigma factor RsiW
MRCTEVREQFFDLADGRLPAAAAQHIASCSDCAAEWKSMQATLALLDEWQAPEPSPYFDMRLRARLREEAAAPATFMEKLRAALSPAGLMGRKAALASAMAVLLVSGVLMFQGGTPSNPSGATPPEVQAKAGTPVGDLMTLDKNHDLYADFDLLDDDAATPNQPQEPVQN